MKIPWKLKSLLFRVLTFCPPEALYFVQQHVTRHAKVDITEPYIGWEYHRKVIESGNIQTVIEFGAGKNLAQNLYLSAYVKNQTVIDLFPMMDLELVNDAIRQLIEIGAPIDGRPVSSAGELEEIYGIRYLAPLDLRRSGLPSNSFDLCISTNTLEHIPVKDIESILIELRRLLRHTGGVSTMIDYSDHYAHGDPKIGRLNYLQYTEEEWEKHNHSNHYQNRLRHAHFGAMFKKARFELVEEECINYCEVNKLSFIKDLLTGNDTDFATTGFFYFKTK